MTRSSKGKSAARALAAFVAAATSAATTAARAAEHPIGADVPPPSAPRDAFLTPPPAGTWASFDAYTAGLQATLERRFSIQRDDYAAIVPRVNTLASRVWRTYAFAPGVEGTRDLRSAVDDEKVFTTENWGYGEGRVRMVLPVAQPVFFMGNAAARYEDCPNNSFDWLHTTMHDRGWLFRYDATVFFRSATIGALGPTVRVMDLPRRGGRELETAVGFTGGRRLGFFQNDLFLVNVLTRPGDDSFGFQILRMPVYALLVYRVSVEL